MKTIYKYEISVGKNEIDLPLDNKILAVQMQNGKPCIWVLLDPEEETHPCSFEVYGTGHIIKSPENKIYIGTWQEGPYVWHLFKKK